MYCNFELDIEFSVLYQFVKDLLNCNFKFVNSYCCCPSQFPTPWEVQHSVHSIQKLLRSPCSSMFLLVGQYKVHTRFSLLFQILLDKLVFLSTTKNACGSRDGSVEAGVLKFYESRLLVLCGKIRSRSRKQFTTKCLLNLKLYDIMVHREVRLFRWESWNIHFLNLWVVYLAEDRVCYLQYGLDF